MPVGTEPSAIASCPCCSPGPPDALYLTLANTLLHPRHQLGWGFSNAPWGFVWESLLNRSAFLKADEEAARNHLIVLPCSSRLLLAYPTVNSPTCWPIPAATARSRRTKTFTYQVSTEVEALQAWLAVWGRIVRIDIVAVRGGARCSATRPYPVHSGA